MLTIRIAGLPIGIDNKNDLSGRFHAYLTDEEPLFTVSVSEAEIHEEESKNAYSDEYREFICLYRKIAERLPDYDAFVFHGAAVVLNNRSYLFTAASGTGKTTHVNLWLRRYPEAWILNGDKPVIRRKDGVFFACGTPWKGKENQGRNRNKAIRGICLLHRAEDNSIRSASGAETAGFLMQQIYRPKDPQRLNKLISLLNECCEAVPVYSLFCNTDLSAAELSCETMSGLRSADT